MTERYAHQLQAIVVARARINASALTIRLDPALERQLEEIARASGRSKCGVVRDAVAGQAEVLMTGDRDLLVLGHRAPVPVLDPWLLDPRP